MYSIQTKLRWALLLFSSIVINVGAEPLALDAVNVRHPAADIITAGQPAQSDIAKLKQAGVTTVINMRTAAEYQGFDEKKAFAAEGINYVHIPVAGAQGMSRENAQKLDQALAQRNKGKAFVYCASGNRVGGLFALRAYYILEQSSEEAMRIGKAAGLTRLTPVVAAKLTAK